MKRSEPWVKMFDCGPARESGRQQFRGQRSAARFTGWRRMAAVTQGSLRFTLGFMLPPAPQAG
ncbi:MAG: hypothetical protein ACRD6N_15790 [Pyrinomonadaceae bacterium]